MTKKELHLRRVLWFGHCCDGGTIGQLYGDDGEMQCSNCGSDFLRHSFETIVDNINRKLIERITEG